MRVDLHRVDPAHQWASFIDTAKVVFVKIPAASGVIGGKGDCHKRLGSAAGHHHRSALGVFTLLQGQAQAVAEETLDQDDDVTAVRRPATGFCEGQGT